MTGCTVIGMSIGSSLDASSVRDIDTKRAIDPSFVYSSFADDTVAVKVSDGNIVRGLYAGLSESGRQDSLPAPGDTIRVFAADTTEFLVPSRYRFRPGLFLGVDHLKLYRKDVRTSGIRATALEDIDSILCPNGFSLEGSTLRKIVAQDLPLFSQLTIATKSGVTHIPLNDVTSVHPLQARGTTGKTIGTMVGAALDVAAISLFEGSSQGGTNWKTFPY
jgi:hypothetical protein